MAQQWKCHRSGDCCRTVGAVTMTPAERDEILRATDRPLTFRDGPAPGFVQLVGTPACPLLDGRNCGVYAVRPYNCRRWGCFRPTTDEPLGMAVQVDHDAGDLKPIRLWTSKPVARQWRRMQAHAQPWALAHGWVPDAPESDDP